MSSRRLFLQSLSAAGLASCLPDEKNSLLAEQPLPPEEEVPAAGQRDMVEPITAIEDFYVTSAGPPPPQEWLDSWTLTIRGLGEDVLALRLDELQALPQEQVEHTLECIGNTGPRLISNGQWDGVLLADLLQAYGLEIDTSHLVMRCGDGYTTSLPVSVIEDGLRLVWTLNGEDLPLAHGQPVRLLVPGRYGMKNPKWIQEIEFTNEPELGFWEQYGWSDTAFYLIHSWIHRPSANTWLTGGEGIDVVGSAFAGRDRIDRVEISFDAGESWQDCEITYPSQENAWTLWRYRWNPPATGPYTLMVRATDEHGNRQQDQEQGDRDLDGLQGIHRVRLFVN